jgi:hypothetical protein
LRSKGKREMAGWICFVRGNFDNIRRCRVESALICKSDEPIEPRVRPYPGILLSGNPRARYPVGMHVS